MVNENPYADRIALLAMKKAMLDDKKKSIRDELRKRLEAEAKAEIEEAEREFAYDLKEAVLGGVPVTHIQRDVLRTTTWSAWTKWRDLAAMPSVRDLNAKAKQDAKNAARWFRWNADERELTLTKNLPQFGGYVFKRPWVFVVPYRQPGQRDRYYMNALTMEALADWKATEKPDTANDLIQTLDAAFIELIQAGEFDVEPFIPYPDEDDF